MSRPISTIRVCAALLSALAVAACSKMSSAPELPAPKVDASHVVFDPRAPQRDALKTQAAQPRTAEDHRVTGRLVWDEDATVRIYSPFGGRVRSLDAKLGQRLDAGAPLAEIESPDFAQAQADARKARADLVLAERTLDRLRDIYEHGAAARKDRDAAENAYASSLAEVQRAEARLAFYGAPPSNAIDGLFALGSPLPGVVVERNLNVGQEVRADAMLANAPQFVLPQFVVSDPRRLWVLLDATEMEMGLFKPGQELRITSRAFPGRSFRGRLEVVGDELDSATRTIKARGTVDNADLLLKAEMYVDVEAGLDSAPDSSVEVRSGAVVTEDDHTFVFVESSPGTYERRDVRIGAESDGMTLVRGGLKPGESVVVEGSLLLNELLESGGHS